MLIPSDEESLCRMLGVTSAKLPDSVITEYELRIRMFHCDGHGGGIGTVGLIDLLRSLGLSRASTDKPNHDVDWSRVPMDGSVRVRVLDKTTVGRRAWRSGVFLGQVAMGGLAVRFDGEEYVTEATRSDVRIIRDEPMPQEDLRKEDPSLENCEPWASMTPGEEVIVEEAGDYKDGKYQCVLDDEVIVLVDGELTSRAFHPNQISCNDLRLKAIAGK